MKKTFLLFLTSFAWISAFTQTEFNIVVPGRPIVQGESFQVQYIFQGNGKPGNLRVPTFNPFRFVSGPNQYIGKNNKGPVNNFVFTLQATQTGRFVIPSATATVNGKTIRTDDAYVQVITKQEAEQSNNSFGNADYMLRPGEDPYEKIRQNLFVKVLVDRRSCYAGEPIVATFKLYSRLQSRSDIVKNPGFYGFTVYDMVNLSDAKMMTEIVNGRPFDVHTIRQVQLFPLQEGSFIIDPMEIVNRIEFSRSSVNKKTEQEIVEGVLGNNDDAVTKENAEVYETKLSTEPVSIKVKPLPALKKPEAFNGAVGHFNISTSVTRSSIGRNEEDSFEIRISGQGNFTQIVAPTVIWPQGIEGFEPVIKDSIDKSQIPLKGSRSFRYPFSSSRPGHYSMPAISFAYYDPQQGYRAINSEIVSFAVTDAGKKMAAPEEKKTSITQTNARASRIAVIIVVSLFVMVIIYWISRKREEAPMAEQRTVLPTPGDFLQSAKVKTDGSDREFYAVLHQSLWSFFSLHVPMTGSEMKKNALLEKLKTYGFDQDLLESIDRLFQQCEAGMFTLADLGYDKNETWNRAFTILSKADGIFRGI